MAYERVFGNIARMTRSRDDVRRAQELLDRGLSVAATARQTGIPRSTINDWLRDGIEELAETRLKAKAPGQPCDACDYIVHLPEAPYSYLLGLYLGDGCIASHPRDVYRLRIVLDKSYPKIIAEARGAMSLVIPSDVGQINREGCYELTSYSKHWPCLFPQHGPGRKHLRPIVLEAWQKWLAIERSPQWLLRGFIHSDGCRATNTVKHPSGVYAYPRYMFSNRSADIRAIFTEACERVGIECKPTNRWTVAISKKKEVTKMDQFIGPKS
jgi:hypothetical protein